jgi:PAS domain S-box-containing protein
VIQLGIFTAPSTITAPIPELIVVLALAWLLLGTMTFLMEHPKTKWVSALELGAYYVLAITQTVCITTVSSPFAAYWVLLFMATYIFLGMRGLRVGVMVFIAMLAIDTLLPSISPEHMLMAVFTGMTVLISTVVIVTVYASQETSHQELVSSRARENTERDRIATLVNNLTDAVLSTDEHGIVQIYNAAALNLLDTNDRLEGKHVNELLQLETIDHTAIDTLKELASSTTIRLRDDIIMPLEGEDRMRLEVTFAPVQGGESITPNGYVLILRDITKMKSLEEERDEFISVVSHELRTPITIAEGSLSNAQVLSERGAADVKIDEALDEAHKQVLFLARMVNDLGTLSRAERGIGDTKESIDITELVAQLQNEYTPQAEEKGLAFNIDPIGKVGSVHASRLYLEELLQNLITNAIKYTPEGSVTLAIKRDHGSVCFQIIDTGIGIGKSDQKKIFDRFYRAEDYRTRQTSGTGLGLYVSAKLARKLGCKITVQSRINHGSTFAFMLPSESKHTAKK